MIEVQKYIFQQKAFQKQKTIIPFFSSSHFSTGPTQLESPQWKQRLTSDSLQQSERTSVRPLIIIDQKDVWRNMVGFNEMEEMQQKYGWLKNKN